MIVDDSIGMAEKEELEALAKMNNIKIEYVDRAIKEDKDIDTLKLPDLKVGDEIKIGRWKNRKAIIKGFKKDKNNHPIMKTNKGDQQVFKARISKLMPEKLDEAKIIKINFGSYVINVYKNPMRSEFKALLKRYKELRGLIDKNFNLYIWNAHDFDHWKMMHELNIKTDCGLFFALKEETSTDVWELNEINGIWFGVTHEQIADNSKHLKRILGLDKLKEAAQEKIAKILIIVLDREEALFALMQKQGYKLLTHIKGEVTKKAVEEKTKSTLYSEIRKQIKEYDENKGILYKVFKILSSIILLSSFPVSSEKNTNMRRLRYNCAK